MPKLIPELTSGETEVLAFVRTFVRASRSRPTINEVARGLRRPTQRLEADLQALCDCGHIERVESRRGTVLVLVDLLNQEAPPVRPFRVNWLQDALGALSAERLDGIFPGLANLAGATPSGGRV